MAYVYLCIRTLPSRDLPPYITRLFSIYTALQHALSHALATCAISPTPDSGLVRNVLNHLSLATYTGLSSSFQIDDLKRLCWIWEWDAKSLPAAVVDSDDNPFLDNDWTRGSMGIVVTPTTHYSKRDRKRVPAYGIGVEVEMNLDKDMGGGMAAVARWTAGADSRRSSFLAKLERWVELHDGKSDVASIPMANLPPLSAPATQVSSLTRVLASCSPKASLSLASSLARPSSPTPTKSPTKKITHLTAVPFPEFPARLESPVKGLLFPQTPSRRGRLAQGSTVLLTPSSSTPLSSNPSTPVHQRGPQASTAPETPSTSRRQALYERIRQRSLTTSPTKSPTKNASGAKVTRDQIMKMGQDEMRRRCLLGRLGGIAESVWMLFSAPAAGSTITPVTRKRRALPQSEVVTAIIKSSPVPISNAEANESLQLNISGEEWLEMPAPNSFPVSDETPKAHALAPPNDSAKELVARSPRRVKRDAGGLREVREIIRKELELGE
ncbi:hypothetical protein BDQ17DRAFT_1388606 [Cyathus striatus]|nr:hypothetical protein BDQ17DRAFT_1388606 [Cyathus striatus]